MLFLGAGPPDEPHNLLAAVLPLNRPLWFEATVIPRGGGPKMIMGVGAVPMDHGIDIGWVGHVPSLNEIVGPFGPARLTTTGMERPPLIDDAAWLRLRGAAGMVIRARLHDLGGVN
jgi:hypothetical protein